MTTFLGHASSSELSLSQTARAAWGAPHSEQSRAATRPSQWGKQHCIPPKTLVQTPCCTQHVQHARCKLRVAHSICNVHVYVLFRVQRQGNGCNAIPPTLGIEGSILSRPWPQARCAFMQPRTKATLVVARPPAGCCHGSICRSILACTLRALAA